MKLSNIFLSGIAMCLAVLPLASCSDDDDMKQLPSAIVPTSVVFTMPDKYAQLVYTDETGTEVLPLIKGESVKFDYTLYPDTATFKDVAWTSTNESVATVTNDGTVTAVSGNGTGYSMIQVAPEAVYAGSGINASIKVVVSNTLIQAEELTVSSTADEVYSGDQLQMSVSIVPSNSTYKTVKWSVSDESAASIDSKGLLTAKQADAIETPVTVIATALDGSEVVGEKTIIVRKIVQPENVSIDQAYSVDNGYYCAMNEKTLNLAYTTTPSVCTTSLIEWTSSDETIATVQNGIVTFNQSGNFGEVTITATCPETGKSSSIKLNLPAGFVRETFHDQNNYGWYNAKQSGNGTESSHVWHDGYITITTYKQNATKQRGDLKCWNAHTYLHAGNYPFFAIKMDDVKDKGAKSRAIKFDAVGTGLTTGSEFAPTDGNNKYAYDLKCSDGSHVFIYNLATIAYRKGDQTKVASEVVDYKTMGIKYADMDGLTEQTQYNVYWVQTFKTLDDVYTYIKSEGLTYE